ncbi:hypothetical protein [Rhizobium paknamense]|uniref:Holin n=1 Tax=Rhizobium paknamense TaxID=1206817 RepID=A0ABU0I7R9_9HYPH|nr:hypothetical protein [Rhizobium paknamense]MDQ0454274.1 hypothetical protein [Rhizobium paknamense]
MNETKPWYGSRAVWGALVAIAAGGLQVAGIDLGLAEQGQMADLLMALASAVGGLVALYGRLAARSAITGKGRPPG